MFSVKFFSDKEKYSAKLEIYMGLKGYSYHFHSNKSAPKSLWSKCMTLFSLLLSIDSSQLIKAIQKSF